MVKRYRHAIHTQAAEDFLPLWNPGVACTLISPGGCFTGVNSIYQDFLLGGIRKAYPRIDLLPEDINVRITGDSAIVLFAYSTDCIRRETGEPFSIAGLETQVYNHVNGEWKLTHVHHSPSPKKKGSTVPTISFGWSFL